MYDKAMVVAQWLQFGALVIIALLFRHHMPAYLKKKGENLATKEDIGEITQKVESVRTQHQSELEQLKSLLETQKQLYVKVLDLQTIKLNRVLPVLEELNREISEHRMMYSNYLRAIINKSGLPDDFEEKRAKIDRAIVEKIHRIAIYLPLEYRKIVNRLRRLVSVSFQDPAQVYYSLLESGKSLAPEGEGGKFIYSVITRADDIYNYTLECFFSMTHEFCSLGEEPINYIGILKDYGFNGNAELISTDTIDRFGEVAILFHEYHRSGELADLYCTE